MAHLANTTSVQTEITAASLAPINTQRMPDVNPTLPPDYHVLNASNPTPPQTPADSPGGPPFPGHPIPGFIPTLPPFPSSNPNPSGTIPTVAPNPADSHWWTRWYDSISFYWSQSNYYTTFGWHTTYDRGTNLTFWTKHTS
jgi:hypothetical protein